MKTKSKTRRCGRSAWMRLLAPALVLVLLWAGPAVANDFAGYQNYSNPADQHFVVLPEITGGWFAATDYFPDNGAGDTIGNYETAGRALVANGNSIYLQKNYGAGAGTGTWTPGDDHGVAGDNMPGGHDNWIVVATVTPGYGYGHTTLNMDPSFIHISPDGTQVALGMGFDQPLLVFPISRLDPDNPPLLNDATDPTVPNYADVRIFPWGSDPVDGVQYYEAEWVPDPEDALAFGGDGKLDPSAATNNYFLAINTDRNWVSQEPHESGGSSVELLDTRDAANRPIPTIVNIGYSPNYSASSDLTVDHYGNLITGQGYDYNDPENGETGQIKIFAADDWMYAYNGDPEEPDPIEYDHESHIIADKVLSAAAMGVDKDNNLHVGGGDVVSGTHFGELGFGAVIHADVLQDALSSSGSVGVLDEGDPSQYKELQPDQAGDDSATFAVYNPWAEGIVLIWNPRNWGDPEYLTYDGWYPGVTPVATTFYAATAPDSDGDGIPNGSDNAYLTPNPGQEDTDGDGWANAADADYTNDGRVLPNDYNLFRQAYGKMNDNIDMTGDGRVLANDYNRFRGRYGTSAPFY